MLFGYSSQPHVRRHGPRGYTDYRSFKPWLRDEFGFRCVFCLWRESWCADGDAAFSVDHLRPQSRYPQAVNDYGNMVYACAQCNAMKQDADALLDPCREAWRDHLNVRSDGAIEALTAQGGELVAICRLDRPALTEARRRLIALVAMLTDKDDAASRQLLLSYRGFPQNLPALAQLRPPGGNERPEGIATSYYELRRRGELAATY